MDNAPKTQSGMMPLAESARPAREWIDELRARGRKAGADFLGVADMAGAYATVAEMTGRPVRPGDAWPRAVSVGVALDEGIVNGIPKVTAAYGVHFYREGWPAAKKVAAALSAWLKQEGFATARSSRLLPGGGIKVAARYAGLAWIGKSCLAVSPEVGPRAAWEVVFTNAPLTPSAKKPLDRQCGDCRRCVDICPVKAYTGIDFNEKDNPRKRYDTGKCLAYRRKLGNIYTIGACALCMEVCPYGKASNILLGSRPVAAPPAK